MEFSWRRQSLLLVIGLFVLLASCGVTESKARRNRGGKDELTSAVTGNEITSENIYEDAGDISGDDESLMKGRDSGWDPSFLDILSSDYFDEGAASSKVNKQLVKIGDDDDGDDEEVGDQPSAGLAAAASDEDPMGAQTGVEEEEITATNNPICSGCARDVDPEDRKIQDIATFAFQNHLKSLDDSEQGRHFVRVVKAQTQVVAGQKYMLDMELGYSNCSKAEQQNTEDKKTCLIDPEKDTFICNFVVLEQKWRNHTELLVTKCDQVVGDLVQNQQEEIGDEGQQRDPEEAEGRIGELDSDEMEEILGSVTTSTSATTTTSEETKRKRKKREALSDANKSIGGLRDADEDKTTLMDLAKFAVEQLDVIDDDNDARLVMDILSAKKQTVSGWLYHLRIRVAQTTCEEGTEISYEKCKDKISLPYSVCNIKVLFQPWQTVQKKVTESQCSQEKMKKGKKLGKQYYFKKDNGSKLTTGNEVFSDKAMLGGYSPVDPNSSELDALTEFVVSSMDAQSNALHAQKLIRVIEAQRQVVSGVKTKMVIEIGYTCCRKSKELERSKCEIDTDREHNFCRVTVWEQPWLKTRKVTDAKCGKKEELYGVKTSGSEESQDKRKKRSASPEPYPLQVVKTRGVMISDPQQHLDLEEKKFVTFMSQYEKKYETQEEHNYRLGVFKQNLRKIKLLQEYEEGTATYGVTRFADLTEEEFSGGALGLRPDLKRKHKHVKKANIPNIPRLPDEFDWRHYNAVTPVKNQGLCGSCWAFSVTGNIEGLYAVKHKELASFSEQELVDCDTLDQGCNGGLPENAYKILEKIGGLETEASYPYDGRDEKCNFDSSKVKAKIKGFVELPKNETEMAKWLTKNGPISIGINANAMQFYWGGVSKPWKFLCSPKSLDHGVLIVGYGVHTTSIRHKVMPYWLVKNSWGPNWGEKGYYRVYRGANTCGIAEMATSATIF